MAETFSVVGQRQTVDLGPDGRFTDVVEVTFRIPSGATGQVRVPVSQYTPEHLRELIDGRAASMIAVEQL